MFETEAAMLDGVQWMRFQDVDDDRGRLTAVESGEHIPFDIARVFYVHHVAPGVDRGGHAHRDTDQVLSCVAGRMKVDVSDGASTKTFVLDDAAKGLFVPRMVWIRLYDFEDRAVLAVYANTPYDRSRSIRTWGDYRAAIGLASTVLEPGTVATATVSHGLRITMKHAPRGGDGDLLRSAMTDTSLHTDQEVMTWLASRGDAARFSVERKRLTDLRGWRIDAATGNVVHESGKFFQVIGVDVATNFGSVQQWRQPIMNQPEIGILGWLTQKIGGELHFLAQAKMEPGNVNLLQISPTLQATRSNFTQVHGGKKPDYLEYFLNAGIDNLLVDQLQSEQGSRFLGKRNRNMIVRVPDDVAVPAHDDFRWVTLAQIHRFLRVDNLINMDARSVLSGIRYDASSSERPPQADATGISSFHDAVLRSAVANDRSALHSTDAVIRWFMGMKSRFELRVQPMNLRDIDDWVSDGDSIRHVSGRYFAVIGVSVSASTREVLEWDQPLIESVKGGINCFTCQRLDGELHFLVQGRVEAGTLDVVEMAPTLQYTPANYDASRHDSLPAFADVVRGMRPDQIRHDSLQSEEGGRFYHDQNRYVIAEADPDQIGEIPANFCWMTLKQMKEMIRFNNCFNVEARSLLACLGLAR
jgi:oxidase EvaA